MENLGKVQNNMSTFCCQARQAVQHAPRRANCLSPQEGLCADMGNTRVLTINVCRTWPVSSGFSWNENPKPEMAQARERVKKRQKKFETESLVRPSFGRTSPGQGPADRVQGL